MSLTHRSFQQLTLTLSAVVVCFSLGCAPESTNVASNESPEAETPAAAEQPVHDHDHDHESHAAHEAHATALTDADFETTVMASSEPVLVDFWATWCGPCKKMTPVVNELAGEFEGRVFKVDVDVAPGTAEKFGISAIPTFLVIKDGEVINQLRGVQPKEKLAAALAN